MDVYFVPWSVVLVKMICYGNYDHTNNKRIRDMNDALPEIDTTDTTS